jgi:hypothetical protein
VTRKTSLKIGLTYCRVEIPSRDPLKFVASNATPHSLLPATTRLCNPSSSHDYYATLRFILLLHTYEIIRKLTPLLGDSFGQYLNESYSQSGLPCIRTGSTKAYSVNSRVRGTI